MNIYGTIGYTIFNNNNHHHIIVFADMHDSLKECDNNIIISDWIKNKFDSSVILLEEVERINDMKLGEIWDESKHTQELKKLYLNNKNKIIPVDIRPFLIPFSWEINKDTKITLFNYLLMIDNFFCVNDSYIKDKLKYYNHLLIKTTKSGEHFMALKHMYYNFLVKYNDYFHLSLNKINDNILLEINELLDFIMEWFICSNIDYNKTKPIIIHTGLAHSQNILKLLSHIYNYNIIHQSGTNYINNINENNIDGCVKLINQFSQLFG
jgi:hypothetical protein